MERLTNGITASPPAEAAPGSPEELDRHHVFLLQCIEITGHELDFRLIGLVLEISTEQAEAEYSRLRRRIYAATTPATNANEPDVAEDADSN
ncbi:unnamed protein product [Penicillium salamii]|uniref:Uncharacterized protein n=1 Tax=Penicillium salamii TaxID=1612424 RepID=A0A9W4N721_9EURO|nr:unnamed protein product [Penicillium salamii]CAG8273131.1 unnamed protein product [Penicillium salamii]CAG8281295.1 unnamed protein product [Penicillium salamii]CAG8293237.1 unnamed protein product [Penicillium salamii]CAG8310338.1 unnamed protein product [Penicillium salamii]